MSAQFVTCSAVRDASGRVDYSLRGTRRRAASGNHAWAAEPQNRCCGETGAWPKEPEAAEQHPASTVMCARGCGVGRRLPSGEPCGLARGLFCSSSAAPETRTKPYAGQAQAQMGAHHSGGASGLARFSDEWTRAWAGWLCKMASFLGQPLASMGYGSRAHEICGCYAKGTSST